LHATTGCGKIGKVSHLIKNFRLLRGKEKLLGFVPTRPGEGSRGVNLLMLP